VRGREGRVTFRASKSMKVSRPSRDGTLLAVSILAVLSFGLVLLPLAILAGIAAARLRFWPDVLGAGLGVWCAVLWPAIVNWGVPRCEPIVSFSWGVLNGPGQVTQRNSSGG